jgi:hypothetical protein
MYVCVYVCMCVCMYLCMCYSCTIRRPVRVVHHCIQRKQHAQNIDIVSTEDSDVRPEPLHTVTLTRTTTRTTTTTATATATSYRGSSGDDTESRGGCGSDLSQHIEQQRAGEVRQKLSARNRT